MGYKKIKLDEVKMFKDQVLVSVQVREMVRNGLLMGHINDFNSTNRIINNYFAKVIKVGDNVKNTSLGDLVVCSQFAGRHVYTEKNEMIKTISDNIILLKKKISDDNFNIEPETFEAADVNVFVKYILDAQEEKRNGIIIPDDSKDLKKGAGDLVKGKVLSVGKRVETIKKGQVVYFVKGESNPIHEFNKDGKNLYATITEYNIVFYEKDKE